MLVKQIFSVWAASSLVLLAVPGTTVAAQVAELTVSSSAFADGEAIPLRNSAYGDNLSPELSWSGAPEGTEAFTLVLTDPDVPMPNGFVHWVIYNIPGTATGLPENIPSDTPVLTGSAAIAGTTQGVMGMRNPGYFGPRPPAGAGVHHYVFSLYALDTDLELASGLAREAVMLAIEGHIIGEGQVTGIFESER